MCCLLVACCIPLLFPLRFYYFLTRIGQFPPTTGRLTCLWHRCSRCELCHYSSNFSRPSFFPRKVQDLASQSSFSTPEPSLSWQSGERKDSGDKITSNFGKRTSFRRAETTSRGGLGPLKFFGTRVEKFAFTRQKSSMLCPILLVRVPEFRSALPKMNVV